MVDLMFGVGWKDSLPNLEDVFPGLNPGHHCHPSRLGVHTPPTTPTPLSSHRPLNPNLKRSRPTNQELIISPDEAFSVTFSCDFWVQDKKAKSGFSQVTATNCTLQWNQSNHDLDDLKAACAQAARCDLTQKSIETVVNSSAKSNTGLWTCWITSSRNFPKTAARRVHLTHENIGLWISDVFVHRGREPGITYISPHPKKQKKQYQRVCFISLYLDITWYLSILRIHGAFKLLCMFLICSVAP